MGTIGTDISKIIGVAKNIPTINVLVVGVVIIAVSAVIVIDIKNKIVEEYESVKQHINHGLVW